MKIAAEETAPRPIAKTPAVIHTEGAFNLYFNLPDLILFELKPDCTVQPDLGLELVNNAFYL
jgi:hypothetical protein